MKKRIRYTQEQQDYLKQIKDLPLKEQIKLKKEIERLNTIVDIILDFPFFKEECPLNFGFVERELETKAQDVFYEDEWCEKNCDDNYKKCWLKYFDKLKELKESGK